MSRGKIRFAALISAIFVLFINICAFAKVDIPNHTDRFFINDYANVIDSETEDYIFEKGKAYNANGGPQVVVLTMESIDGNDLEDFSIETARKWGIGDKDADNGVLILLVMDSRDIRIEVGYGLEGVLNDGKCGRFIRNATDSLSAGDYSEGIKQIYDSVIGELEDPTPDEEDDDDTMVEIMTYVVFFIVLAIVVFITNIKGRGGRGGYHSGGFHLCRKMNYFLIRKLSAGNNICRQHSAYNTRTAAAQTSRHRYLTVLSYSVTLLLITYIVEKFRHCTVNQIACILWDKALSIFVDYFKPLGNFLNHHSVIQTNSHTESIKTCTHICTGCRHS